MKISIEVLVVGEFTGKERSRYESYTNLDCQYNFTVSFPGGLLFTGNPDLVVVHQDASACLAENVGSYSVPTIHILRGVLDSGKEILFLGSGPRLVVEVNGRFWWDHLSDILRQVMINSRSSLAPEPQASGDSLLLGNSKIMQEVMAKIMRFAQTDHMILIEGESGTGKELAAKELHKHSHVSEKSYISVNCGALTGSILESELFGCTKGAFTGAENRPGYFEYASGGTLFLDEIGEIPLVHQPKLLRVLENREFQRVGGRESMPMTARIIAATNRNLKESVDLGTFRRDLFYRLEKVTLSLPPLRDRLEDIPLLARHFLAAEGYHGPISPAVIQKLTSHSWPGNVRELENVLFRASILCETITLSPDMIELG